MRDFDEICDSASLPQLSLRHAGVIRLLFLIGHLYVFGVWLGDNQRANILSYMFKRDWTTSSGFMKYSTLNSEHNWRDIYSRLLAAWALFCLIIN